jgi:hypothetical protein
MTGTAHQQLGVSAELESADNRTPLAFEPCMRLEIPGLAPGHADLEIRLVAEPP